MTRVIITGAGSYIGTHLGAWLSRRPEEEPSFAQTIRMTEVGT